MQEHALASNHNATYDHSSRVWGQSNTRLNCTFNREPCQNISENSYWFEKGQASSNGELIYPSGVALRFNMYDLANHHGGSSGAHSMSNWNMTNFIGYSLFLDSGKSANVQTAYSHKQIALDSISVSFGSSGGFDIGFGLSGTKTDYFGEPLAIYA